MPIRNRLLIAVLLVTGVAVGLSEVAGAGLSGELEMKGSKRPDGPFSSDLRMKLDEEQAKNVYLKITAPTGTDEEATIRPSLLPVGFKLSYFSSSGKNLNAKVLSEDGYVFTVKPDKPKRLYARIKVTDLDPHPDGACVRIPVRDENDDVAGVTVGINKAALDC